MIKTKRLMIASAEIDDIPAILDIDDNPAGMHLYHSLGFHCDGILMQHHKEKRGILNEAQFSMLKGEYGENESVSV